MKKVAKIAASTVLGAAAIGVTTPLVQGEPTSPMPVNSSKITTPNHLESPLVFTDGQTPIHHFARDIGAISRPRILMLSGTTKRDQAITLSPMIHSPLFGATLLPESIKLTPHVGIQTWHVGGGAISINPAPGFHGIAKASYSIEDSQGTIFTSSIDITVQ